MRDERLAPTLSVGQAIGLGITIVVGSGLLIVPGLAYSAVGDAAVYAWILDAAIVVPLLVVFAYLGSRYPSAGGIAGFVQAAFGRLGAGATEILLLGTFGLGIPAIAITGGNYFGDLAGGSRGSAAAATYVLLAIAVGVNLLGARMSGRTQQLLAILLVLLLATVAIVALTATDADRTGGVAPAADWESWRHAIPAIGIVFFAYTGWEMLSFTAEEYRNPRRDFPLAVAGSFLIVVALYVLIAVALQGTLTQSEADRSDAPLGTMLTKAVGSSSGRIVAALGVLIIGANLIGAVWAASRLVFASAREGLLPGPLARIGARGIPQNALYAVGVAFVTIVTLHETDVISLATLLRLAGQNFFILYGLTVLAFLRLARRPLLRALGFLTLAIVLVTMGTFGWDLLYAAALLVGGTIAARLAATLRRPRWPEPETPTVVPD